ncbi:hypothetical protein A1A1_09856 [Planococcus antarcticus DSM 14505]|uniref:CbiN domain protein n=1 Tax=Planococcus antarcticus DSM 14505 TaxID=1185653 RepID=A0A1C7DH02_9BACL|nr:hypothetical protein [Planococcus antarcticus]ANU10745.1 hypothetical protein BBH88_10725 [Planococcus antarcticus DSM 14505]EIM06841.1 hypothetical protein A1A1_09856 [Planococcus antarcticus DSM 14505]
MRRIMIAVCLLSLFYFPKQGFALSCVEPSQTDVSYDKYDAVIIGTVEKIKENGNKRVLVIEVVKSFKGVNETTITAGEDITWGESRLGIEYLYYLNEEGGKWVHPLCSPTTDNIGIADEFLADKEEIALQNVDTNEIEPKNTVFVVLVLLGMATIGAFFLISNRGKKQL